MSFWRQLRWRIVGGHVVVVIVGVTILLLTAQLFLGRIAVSDIQPRLTTLTQATNILTIEQATTDLLETFQNAVLSSLLVAGLASLLAGLGTSLLLTREILRPLRQITQSSRRIANGHYDERVAVPGSDELALMATDFNQMAEALERIEQQRVALIGNVSHELRTPLSGIEGYLEGMMDGVMPKNEETFAYMYQEVRRLRRLVDDLQALSRVEAGQMSLNLRKFDLIPIVKRIVAHLNPQAIAQNLILTAGYPQAKVWVQGDPDRVAQILVNLVGNAIHYTPEGGRITIQVNVERSVVHIIVQDTGLGIPAEVLPYIFERFYRVDASRARSSGGSGIGLTISRHLAWAMGGELSAASDGPGQGSAFMFTLPRPQIVDEPN